VSGRIVARSVVLLALTALEAHVPGASLRAQSQVIEAGPNRMPRLTYSVMPQNPVDRFGIPVVVSLRVTLDRGRVAEVRPIEPNRGTYSFYVSQPMGGEVLALSPLTDRPSPLGGYDAFARSAIDAVRRWQYDPPADGYLTFDVMFVFNPPSEPRLLPNSVTGVARLDAAPAANTPPIVGPVKVKDVPLAYPPIAQAARVQGAVIIEARIDPDGHVSDARLVSGPPLLQQISVEAVRQWEFTPAVVDGKRVPVLVTTRLDFTLFQ
jgi:TonB family protein